MQVNKSLLKKIVGLLSVLCLAVVMAFGLVACGGKTIASTTINAQGHLIVTYSDNSTADLGLVVGQNGVDNVGLKDGCTHAFVEHTVKYANCSEEGIVLKVCTLCKGQAIGTTAKNPEVHGSYEVELLKTPGPNGEEVSVPVLVYESFETKGGNHKDATCLEAGHSEIICGGCSKVLEKEDLPALEHKRPDGSSAYIDVDGAVLNGNECINGTFTGKVCTLCNDVKDAVYTAPTKGRHTATADWKVIAAPTKDTVGEIKGECAVCKTEQTMELPKLNATDYAHEVPTCETIKNGGEAKEVYTYAIDTFSTSFKFNYDVKHATANGGAFSINEEVAYNKISGNLTDFAWINGVPGNCQETGEATFTCKDCGTLIRIYAKGAHDLVDIVDAEGEIIWTAATCQSNKYKQQSCKNEGCNVVEKVYVQGTQLTHVYKVVGDPVQGANGLDMTIVCTNAGCTEGEKTITATLVEGSEEPATCAKGATATYTYNLNGKAETITVQTSEKSGHKTANGGYFAINEKVEYNKISGNLADFAWINGQPGNCQEEGEATFKCEFCKETIRIYAKGAHDLVDIVDENGDIIWTAATCQSNKYKQQSCKNEGCDVVEKVYVQGTQLTHVYKVVGDPVQTEEGLKITIVCTNAGCTEGEKEIIATLVEGSEEPATCEKGATVDYTFNLNGKAETITVQTSEKSAHKTASGAMFAINANVEYEAIKNIIADLTWINGAPGNCLEEGEATFKCEFCKETIRIYAKGTHVIASEPDKYEDGSIVTKAPTCTAEGFKACYTCTACGDFCDVKPEDVIPANGHEWTAEVVDGKVKLTCSECNTIIEGIIDRIDNTSDAPECGIDGTVIYYYYENQTDADAETNLKSVTVKAAALEHDFTDAEEITFKMEINGKEYECKAKKCNHCGKYYIYQPPVDEIA